MLNAKEQSWVQATRDEIMETVNDFVPISDATRLERMLDDLIDLLKEKLWDPPKSS